MIQFALAVLLLIVTPGPGVLSAAGFGAGFGFRAGLVYVIGLFVGNFIVALSVVTGVAALVLANPNLRLVLTILSVVYIVYLAARIAFAGSKVAFVAAQEKPGFWAGVLLQVINPKAYVVNTTLFSGFVLMQGTYVQETLIKFAIIWSIWIPIHLAWMYAGTVLGRLDLSARVQSGINMCMAAALLIVVGLSLWSI